MNRHKNSQTPARMMRAAVLLATMLMSSHWAGAENVVVLKDEAYVKGPQVLLGDVAEVQGEDAERLAEVEITPAPVPGSSKRIDAALLKSRIQSAGHEVAGLELGGARSVKATTLSLEVTSEMIEEDLRRFIKMEMPWDPENTTIDIAPPKKDLVLPEGELELVWRPNPLFNWLGNGSFRGEVMVDGAVSDVLMCNASVESYGDVVVAAKDIPRGAIVSAGDLETEKRALSSMKRGFFQHPDELIGMVARTTVFPGTVLTARHVMARRLVKRNQTVSVETRQGGLVLRDRAIALGDGCAGDTVICRTMTTKEEFVGVVREDGTVLVE